MSGWRKQRAGNDLPSLWECVSCGFIIHAAESHTEAAESLLNGTIFSKTEKDEVRKRTQKWWKAFAVSNGAICSPGRHRDNFSARFLNKRASRSMLRTLLFFLSPVEVRTRERYLDNFHFKERSQRSERDDNNVFTFLTAAAKTSGGLRRRSHHSPVIFRLSLLLQNQESLLWEHTWDRSSCPDSTQWGNRKQKERNIVLMSKHQDSAAALTSGGSCATERQQSTKPQSLTTQEASASVPSLTGGRGRAAPFYHIANWKRFTFWDRKCLPRQSPSSVSLSSTDISVPNQTFRKVWTSRLVDTSVCLRVQMWL